VLGIIKMEKV